MLLAVLFFYLIAIGIIVFALYVMTHLDSSVLNLSLSSDLEKCRSSAKLFKKMTELEMTKYCTDFTVKRLYYYFGVTCIIVPIAISAVKKELIDSIGAYIDHNNGNKKLYLMQSMNLSVLIYALPIQGIIAFALYVLKSADMSGLGILILTLSVHLSLIVVVLGSTYLNAVFPQVFPISQQQVTPASPSPVAAAAATPEA